MKATPAYKQFLKAFANFTAADQRVEKFDGKFNASVLSLVTKGQGFYLAAVADRKVSEDAVRKLAAEHPEWFNGKQSLKTPHGTVSKRKTTSLDIDNESIAVRLISETYGHDVIVAQGGVERTLKGSAAILHVLGSAAEFLHIEITPNREALEKLTDDELRNLGITRKSTETITPKPLKVDLGKAIEAAKEPQPAQAA